MRRRFTALGEDEHAREAEAAWIGTIHGFCARVLRARPLAAGLDPRFTVLDEPAARRLAERAYERALEAWAAARGAPRASTSPPPTGRRCATSCSPPTTRCAAAAQPIRGCRSRRRGRRPTPARSPPRATPRPPRSAARPTARRSPPRARRSTRCERSAARAATCRGPATLDAAKLGGGAKALDGAACAAYREAWEAYRAACADHHARAALVLLDDLLERFGAAYDEAKAARAAVDFEDLELRVRDLLADPRGARRAGPSASS